MTECIVNSNRIWSLPKLSFGTVLFRKRIQYTFNLLNEPLTCDFSFSSDRN